MTLLNLLDELYRRDIVVRMAGEQFQVLDFHKRLTPELKTSIDHFIHTLAAYLRRADSSISLPFAPLSFAQKRLWYFAHLTPEDTVTHTLKFEARLLTPPNIPALKYALDTLVQRHPMLRTTYRDLGGGTPVQQTRKELPPAFEVFDSAEWSRDEIGQKMQALSGQPTNLRKGPILRCYLFALPRGRYIFKLLLPYLAADIQSLELLMDELSELYIAAKNNETMTMPPIESTYAEYVRWKLNMLAGKEGKRHRAYIDKVMAGDVPVINLPFDRPRPPRQTFNTSSLFLTLTTTVTQQVKAFANAEHISLHGLLMSLFFVLLHRYTGQQDILIGSPRSEQGHRRYKGVVGYFDNPLPIRTQFTENPTFRHFCRAMQQTIWEAFDHEEYPSHHLAHQYHLARDASHPPLFQAIFIMQEPHQRRNISPFLLGQGGDRIELDGLIMQSVGFDDKARIFVDLQLTLFEEHGSLTTLWQYNTDLFDEETIARMGECFRILLQGALADPELRISDLPLMTAAQREEILITWNQTAAAYSKDKCLHQLFEEQVERAPDATALVFEQQRLTYRELNARANQLARHLSTLGVGPEMLVGVYVERSLDMIVGLLGILKAGGAYLPIDPIYPPKRVALILEDARPAVILSQQALAAELTGHEARIILVDRDWQKIAQEDDSNVTSDVMPEHLAYTIYTSGSTGIPKGVQIAHYSAAHLFDALRPVIQFDEHDIWTVFHSYAFDFSVWEIWAPLVSGGRLVVVPMKAVQSPEALHDLLYKEGVTILNQTPSAIKQLLAVKKDEEANGKRLSLRAIICGGEALPPQLAAELLEWEIPLWNFYGPTETTVWATIQHVERIQSMNRPVSVGRPFANMQTYILDAHLQPLPIGVCGELHIGGIGLALGYFQRPELTQEKFIPNPFEQDGNAPTRLYKTGDIARYLPDGSIEFLGRSDHQVKIRGFRIELGEIEAAIRTYPAIKETIVIDREDEPGQKYLAAYLIPTSDYREIEQMDAEAPELNAGQVEQWQNVYDNIYSQAAALSDATFNIVGWNDSYTGKPIPSEEMLSWVQSTVERIQSMQPQRILEIGCGTGLLLFRLASRSQNYWGTDISPVALEFLQQQAISQRHLPITLRQQAADDFHEIPSGAFDTVIMNAVAQHFPNVEYLIQVIERAVNAILPNRGVIFLGDLRSHPLLELFHASVQFFQAPPALNAAQLRQRVHRQISHENELTLDPALFFALKARIPAITAVRVQPKRGSARNEMTRFRYDVTLFVNGKTPYAFCPERAEKYRQGIHPLGKSSRDESPAVTPPPFQGAFLADRGFPGDESPGFTPPPFQGEKPMFAAQPYASGGEIRWLDWRAEGLTLPDLHQRVKETQPEAFGVTNIPNARLFYDLHVRDWLEDRETYASAEEARQALHEHAREAGIDPEEFWNFERKLPEYQIELSWARHGRDGAFDALFIRRDAADRVAISFPEPEIAPKSWSAYANDPLRGKHLRALIPRLRAFIEKKLPDYMIPAAFVLLEALPLTPNGKINRHALPAPERTRPEVAAAYVAPTNELETVLTNLWEELLDLERLGIHDDFFELGGDSLSMTRMLMRLKQDLDVIVTQTDMFDVHTVAQLTEVVERKMREEIEQLSDEEAAALLADAERNDITI